MSERRLRIESNGLPGGTRVVDCESGQPIAGIAVVAVQSRDGHLAAMLQLADVELQAVLLGADQVLPGLLPTSAPALPPAKKRGRGPAKAKVGGRKSRAGTEPKPRRERAARTASAEPSAAKTRGRSGVVQHNDIEINFDAGTATFCRERIALQGKELSLLELLAKAMPNPVERGEIIRRAWGGGGQRIHRRRAQHLRRDVARQARCHRADDQDSARARLRPRFGGGWR